MGHLAIVQYLLDHIGEEEINCFDVLSFTPLTYAGVNNHLDVARLLLANGADVDAHEEKMIGNTPLAEAVREGTPEMVKLLLDAGADPTIPGWMGLTAYHRAEQRVEREPSPQAKEVLSLIQTAKATL